MLSTVYLKTEKNNLTIDLATFAVEVIHRFAVVGRKCRREAFLGNVTLTSDRTIHGNLTSRSLPAISANNSSSEWHQNSQLKRKIYSSSKRSYKTSVWLTIHYKSDARENRSAAISIPKSLLFAGQPNLQWLWKNGATKQNQSVWMRVKEIQSFETNATTNNRTSEQLHTLNTKC